MKNILIATIISLLALLSIPVKQNTVILEVNNPYSMEVRLEVKCDHDWTLNRFRFHRFISVGANQGTTIAVPNNLKRCQIWPKVIWW